MPDPVITQPTFFKDIPVHNGPYAPNSDYVVGVKNDQEIRIPMRLLDNGRDRVVNVPIVAGAVTIPIETTDYFVIDLTEDLDQGWTFGVLSDLERAATIAIQINQGATPMLLEWPTTFWWQGDAPLISMVANASDLLVITTLNGGVSWLADLARGYRAPTP